VQGDTEQSDRAGENGKDHLDAAGDPQTNRRGRRLDGRPVGERPRRVELR
jgi:hypothetical protein